MIPLAQHMKAGLKNDAARIQIDCAAAAILSNESGILVVDDDAGVRQTLAWLLTEAGYKTSSAQNGFEALQKIRKEAPDPLLCDLEMPVISGFELLTIVRRQFPLIAAVAMSGSYEGDAIPEGVLADAYYGKGQNRPAKFFEIVAEAMQAAAWRAHASNTDLSACAGLSQSNAAQKQRSSTEVALDSRRKK